MKKQIYPVLVIVFISISSFCFAQSHSQNKGKAKCISAKGYWVIENNIKTPKSNTIYFYNNDNVMVYKEKIEGIKLNTNKRKTLLKLKSALEQSVVAWESGHKETGNNVLVMTAFKK
jgi:hypothetical protein